MARAGKGFLVDTKPTKLVVVESLTRDVTVEACIFDLIDNSVDAAGATIMAGQKQGRAGELPVDYAGFEVTLKFSGEGFSIEDNCGGISVADFKDDVLRFGKRSAQPLGIGVFGVGLNRALFRLGKASLINTDTGKRRAVLLLNVDDYLKNENEWELPAEEFPSSGKIGTKIEVQHLQPSIAQDFADSDWTADLQEKIGQRYGRFIAKGFKLTVNGTRVKDRLVEIRENSPYEGEYKFFRPVEGVSVHMKYGQHVDHRFSKEIDYDKDRNGQITDDFGWTVFCNDRAILINDTTAKTGWDTKWHTEFNGFVGYVNFIGDPEKLPWTTTKIDVDLNNPAYQAALVDMRRFAEKWRSIAEARKKVKEPNLRAIPPKEPPPTAQPTAVAKGKQRTATAARKVTEKPDHNEYRTILPKGDIDEAHCNDKHLALVHEACDLDLVQFNYAGLALMRMLFEVSALEYLNRHGKGEELRQFAIARRIAKGMAMTPAEQKQALATPDEIVAYLDGNHDVWGASKATNLKHSLARLAKHKTMMNSSIHNPYELVNRSQTFQIRDDILPLLRHLIET